MVATIFVLWSRSDVIGYLAGFGRAFTAARTFLEAGMLLRRVYVRAIISCTLIRVPLPHPFACHWRRLGAEILWDIGDTTLLDGNLCRP